MPAEFEPIAPHNLQKEGLGAFGPAGSRQAGTTGMSTSQMRQRNSDALSSNFDTGTVTLLHVLRIRTVLFDRFGRPKKRFQ